MYVGKCINGYNQSLLNVSLFKLRPFSKETGQLAVERSFNNKVGSRHCLLMKVICKKGSFDILLHHQRGVAINICLNIDIAV